MLQAFGTGATVGLAGCSDILGSGSDGGEDGSGSDGGGDGDGSNADLPEVTLYGPDGEQVAPTIFYDQGGTNAENIAQQMKSDLERIGVDLQLEGRTDLLGEDFNSEPLPDADTESFEWGPVGRNAGPPDETRTVADWDLLIGIEANSYPRTPGNIESFWVKDSAVNAYGYVPEADHRSLFEEFRRETDQDRREELIADIFGHLTEELPANFLSERKEYWAFREDINTAPEFNEYGWDQGFATRYRGEQTVGGDYTWIVTTPLDHLFPPENNTTNISRRMDLITGLSYAVDPNDEIIPLYMDIEDSGDNQVYVCTIREGIEWGTDAEGNDYGRMTAEDWVYQTRYVHGVADDAASQWNEETPPSRELGDYEAIEAVEQTGELEFQVELANVDPAFPLRPVLWGEYCLPKELYEQYAPDAQALRQSPEIQNVTWPGNTGPYTFESRTPGVTGQFDVSRNEDYFMRDHVEDSNVETVDEAWAEAPYFESFRIDVEQELTTATERFRNGEGDRFEPETTEIREFQEADEDVRIEEQQSAFISMLFFNMRSNGDPLVRSQAGRQAVSRVIDKQVISEKIQRDYTDPAVTFQPRWSKWYDEEAVTKYGLGVDADDVKTAREALRDTDDFSLEEA